MPNVEATDVHIRWLQGLTVPPSSDEVLEHFAVSGDWLASNPDFTGQLLGVGSWLRSGEEPSLQRLANRLIVRVGAEPAHSLRLDLSPHDARILSMMMTQGTTSYDESTPQTTRIADLYDTAAPTYETTAAADAYYWPSVRAWLTKTVKDGDVVLDLGCGPGQLTRSLPPSVQVFGTDISDAMIAQAKLGRPSGTFVVADFHESLPASWPRAGVALAVGCLDFCTDLSLVARHIVNGCAEGARILITVPRRRPMAQATMTIQPFDVVMSLRSDQEVVSALESADLDVLHCEFMTGYTSQLTGDIEYGLWEANVATPPT